MQQKQELRARAIQTRNVTIQNNKEAGNGLDLVKKAQRIAIPLFAQYICYE